MVLAHEDLQPLGAPVPSARERFCPDSQEG